MKTTDGKRRLRGSRVRWRWWVIDFAGHARGSRHLREDKKKKTVVVNDELYKKEKKELKPEKGKEGNILTDLVFSRDLPVESEAQWLRNRRLFVERQRDLWPRPVCAISRPRPGGVPSSPDFPFHVAVAPSRPAPSPPAPAPPAPVAVAERQ